MITTKGCVSYKFFLNTITPLMPTSIQNIVTCTFAYLHIPTFAHLHIHTFAHSHVSSLTNSIALERITGNSHNDIPLIFN